MQALGRLHQRATVSMVYSWRVLCSLEQGTCLLYAQFLGSAVHSKGGSVLTRRSQCTKQLAASPIQYQAWCGPGAGCIWEALEGDGAGQESEARKCEQQTVALGTRTSCWSWLSPTIPPDTLGSSASPGEARRPGLPGAGSAWSDWRVGPCEWTVSLGDPGVIAD